MNTAGESEKSASAPEVPQPKTKRTKKAKPAKKASRAKKPARKPKADRANKKAEVIAMMKRAKGATLAEIIAATDWQPHTVRGLRKRGSQQSISPVIWIRTSSDDLKFWWKFSVPLISWERHGDRHGF